MSRCPQFAREERTETKWDDGRAIIRGLVDAGPIPSGHRTPTVIASLPLLGLDEATVTAGGWMVQQALAQGVHGVHLARARDPEGVKRFVQAARYPIHKQATDTLGVGLRGWGSHTYAAWVWGLSVLEYLQKADVWPLNPEARANALVASTPRPPGGLREGRKLCRLTPILVPRMGRQRNLLEFDRPLLGVPKPVANGPLWPEVGRPSSLWTSRTVTRRDPLLSAVEPGQSTGITPIPVRSQHAVLVASSSRAST